MLSGEDEFSDDQLQASLAGLTAHCSNEALRVDVHV